MKTKTEPIKVHHLLVMLLRLRQICCHPSLIRSMIDQETKSSEGIEENGEDIDLISAMEDLDIAKPEKKDVLQLYILNSGNPVLEEMWLSSKVDLVLNEIQGLIRKKEESKVIEKAVIVSQWTSFLNIIKSHILNLNLTCAEINGQIPVKSRGDIVDDFNNNEKGAQVMLLSLTAGGVGLNLVGANHLFLMDMHWNPQLEIQASDRIYRVGQMKPVTIHR